jgi:hypothetical protein
MRQRRRKAWNFAEMGTANPKLSVFGQFRALSVNWPALPTAKVWISLYVSEIGTAEQLAA